MLVVIENMKGVSYMKFNFYQDVNQFYHDVYEIMLNHETQNMIPLGNLRTGYEGVDKNGWRDPAKWIMATVTNDENIVLTAMMTPPFGITLYATDNQVNAEALRCLVEGLIVTDIEVWKVVSEKSLAEVFADLYCSTRNLDYKVVFNQRIYELEQVSPEVAEIGELRGTKEADMAFLPYWITGLSQDALNGDGVVGKDPEAYRYYINSGDLFILEVDGVPVSMAGVIRKVEKVCGVGFVYTPPYFRQRGYGAGF